MRFWIIHAVFSVSVKNKNGVIFLQGTIKITKNKEVRFIFLRLCARSAATKQSHPSVDFAECTLTHSRHASE